MPRTAAGEIGEMMIAHINADTPESIQQWASTILSTSVDADMRAAILKQLVVAVRDSGGVEFVDARTQGPPGMLVVTIKGRRTGQRVALVLLPDPEQPGKLAMADIVPVDDPALYAAWPKTGASQDEIAELANTALDQLQRTTDFSGCLSISNGANIIFDECRGLADRSFGVKVDRQTKFHIGSMNKMFTAVAIAQLVETGKLRWDSTLAEVVPEYPDQAAAAKITVWHLLHHTAGLGDFFVPEFFQNREKFVNPGDYLDLIARQPALSDPGGDWNYSNAGYVVLGRIVENVSGEPYFDYIQRHVFAPAGMASSGFDSQEDVTEKLAIGYFKEGAFATSWKANWMTLPFKGSPAGGGYSTNGDLLRFANALRGGKLIGAATLQKMFEDGVPAGPGKYAAGFGDRPSNGRHIRGHAGGAEGMNANLAMVWETGAAVAVTSNQGDTPTAMLLSERIADLLASQGKMP
ncbi:serine hydrolase domain-containing protein [Sphingopyxis sp.]|uniref:serine hydrolase domain-containing protein n=1 Tax=Sphingopyxis sp. TaxID=1908224 RepID=UPI002AC9D719|nr:serine hydrolase domain-containing protein [Sphingopyxis sp.]